MTKILISPDWKTVRKGEYIPVDLENQELQIKTSSNLGIDHLILIAFFSTSSSSDDYGHGNFFIYFKEKMKYHVGWCSPDHAKESFDKTPTITTPTIWRITEEQDTKLLVWCNDELVLEYTFSDSSRPEYCVRAYKKDTTRIQFHRRDSASEQYRVVEGKPLIYSTELIRLHK